MIRSKAGVVVKMSQSRQTSSSLLCIRLNIMAKLVSLSNPAIGVMQPTKNRLAHDLTVGLDGAGDR